MKKVIRLTEADLVKLVKKVIRESESQQSPDVTKKLAELDQMALSDEVKRFLQAILKNALYSGTKALDIIASVFVFLNPFNWYRDQGCVKQRFSYSSTAEDQIGPLDCLDMTDDAKEKFHALWSKNSVSGKWLGMTKDGMVDFLKRNSAELMKIKNKWGL